MRAYFSYILAFGILLLAGGWLATGTLVQGGQGPGNGEHSFATLIDGKEHGPVHTALSGAGILAPHPEPEVDPYLTIAERNALETDGKNALVSVRTKTFTAQPMPIEVSLRGRTQAKASVAAVAETNGTVEAVHVSKGQTVEVGDALCTLDKGTREAAVTQAEAAVVQAQAALAQAQLNYDTNADLRKRGLAATNTANAAEVALSQAKAGVTQAQAGVDNARAELKRTEIVAKVAGVVQSPLASVGSLLAPGAPCATIVQLDPMIFAGMVPEAHIGLAQTGLTAKITTVTGQTVEGEVSYVASVADSATRAFPAEIEIPNPDHAIRDGLTAQATIIIGTAPGHLVPQSVLTLDDKGVLGVRTVEDGAVAFYPVQIVSDTRDGVWVSGLPATAQIITIGQESVSTGQKVTQSEAAAEAA